MSYCVAGSSTNLDDCSASFSFLAVTNNTMISIFASGVAFPSFFYNKRWHISRLLLVPHSFLTVTSWERWGDGFGNISTVRTTATTTECGALEELMQREASGGTGGCAHRLGNFPWPVVDSLRLPLSLRPCPRQNIWRETTNSTEVAEPSSVKMATLVGQQDLIPPCKKVFFPPTHVSSYPVHWWRRLGGICTQEKRKTASSHSGRLRGRPLFSLTLRPVTAQPLHCADSSGGSTWPQLSKRRLLLLQLGENHM